MGSGLSACSNLFINHTILMVGCHHQQNFGQFEKYISLSGESLFMMINIAFINSMMLLRVGPKKLCSFIF